LSCGAKNLHASLIFNILEMNKKDITRDRMIVIRVSIYEKKQIQKNAETYNLSISDLARQFLVNGQAWAKPNGQFVHDALDRKTLIGLANNLNQLTRYAHQKKELPVIIELLNKINKIFDS
tara:strand:- start:15039 stop:15401 length:363 start_codon:yes stop_codon:yes gene_type:complete